MSPTARSLRLLRRWGYLAAPVERWIPLPDAEGGGIRKDLWSFGDILGCHPKDKDFLIVQATSLPNVAARKTKACARPELTAWLAAGGRFEIHGWTNRSGKWSVRRLEITAGESGLADITLCRPRRKARAPAVLAAELF